VDKVDGVPTVDNMARLACLRCELLVVFVPVARGAIGTLKAELFKRGAGGGGDCNVTRCARLGEMCPREREGGFRVIFGGEQRRCEPAFVVACVAAAFVGSGCKLALVRICVAGGASVEPNRFRSRPISVTLFADHLGVPPHKREVCTRMVEVGVGDIAPAAGRMARGTFAQLLFVRVRMATLTVVVWDRRESCEAIILVPWLFVRNGLVALVACDVFVFPGEPEFCVVVVEAGGFLKSLDPVAACTVVRKLPAMFVCVTTDAFIAKTQKRRLEIDATAMGAEVILYQCGFVTLAAFSYGVSSLQTPARRRMIKVLPPVGPVDQTEAPSRVFIMTGETRL